MKVMEITKIERLSLLFDYAKGMGYDVSSLTLKDAAVLQFAVESELNEFFSNIAQVDQFEEEDFGKKDIGYID
jgi:hypothetical protein